MKEGGRERERESERIYYISKRKIARILASKLLLDVKVNRRYLFDPTSFVKNANNLKKAVIYIPMDENRDNSSNYTFIRIINTRCLDN